MGRQARIVTVLTSVLVGTGLGLAPGAAGHDVVRVAGVLTGLPDEGLKLPPSSTVTARIEVPAAGGDRIKYSIDIGPETTVRIQPRRVRNGQRVEVELALEDNQLVVKEIARPGRAGSEHGH